MWVGKLFLVGVSILGLFLAALVAMTLLDLFVDWLVSRTRGE